MPEQSLQKFNQLPAEIRNKLSSPSMLAVVKQLEVQYGVKLNLAFLKLAVGDLRPGEFNDYLREKFNLNKDVSDIIRERLSRLLVGVGLTPVVAGVSGETSKNRSGEAGFSFSIEDDADVSRFKDLESTEIKIKNYEALAENVIAEFGYKNKDESLRTRLKNLIMSRLKDVRDEFELIEHLKKNKEVGGMELGEEEIDKLLKLIRQSPDKKISDQVILPTTETKVETKIEFPVKKVEPIKTPAITLQAKKQTETQQYQSPKNLSAKPVEIKSTQENTPSIEMEDGLPVLKMPEELMIPPHELDLKKSQSLSEDKPIEKKPDYQKKPEPTLHAKQLPVINNNAKQPPVMMAQPVPYLAKKSMPPKLSKISSSRPSLDDVKFTPKLQGPIEELNNMTLIDWRRLGEKTESRIAKIKEKLNLLEKDSYGRRLQGIEAWNKNEINKFYRLLGQESLVSGQEVESIIKERLEKGLPTLTLEEFHSVMELNRDLRY
ncbi:MAG: hypothetical protein WCP18_00070 [bacterium]